MNNKSLDSLRDCIRKVLIQGAGDRDEFIKMCFAITVELRKLGYEPSKIKDVLLDWNKKGKYRVFISKEKNQICGYVDWVFKRDCKIGCTGLKDYCVGEDACLFNIRNSYQKSKEIKNLPFDINELDKYLTSKYRGGGYVMMLIVKAMRYFQHQKNTGPIIFIGLRTIASIIRHQYGHTFSPMDVLRKIRVLIDEGVLQQVEKGKSGTLTRRANGYRFLKWKTQVQEPDGDANT